MRIFITGGTGFIGRALVLRLLRDGHTPVIYTRSPARARALLGSVDVVSPGDGDLALAGALSGCDAVINLAGESIVGGRWTSRRKRALRASRVDLTHRLVDAMAALRRPPRVLVSASAIGYYGSRGDERLSEDDPPGDDFLARLCVDWEAAALRAKTFGTRVVLPRIGVVLGPDGGALERLGPVFRAGLGGPIGSGQQWVSWIHVADLVELITRAVADETYAGPIDAVAPEPVRWRALAHAIGAVTRRPAWLRVPAWALRLGLGEAATALLASQRIAPARLAQLGFRHRFGTLADALVASLRPGEEVEIRRLRPDEVVPRSGYLEQRRPRYRLDQVTVIDAPRSEVFDFFSRAENLAVMTPPRMGFVIQTPGAIEMATGLEIVYRISLGPVPLRWRTRIERWQPEDAFVDTQLRGPYACWWHEHSFVADGDRTIMTDRVWYAPPLGLLGRLAHRLVIARMLRSIFGYRAHAIGLRFGLSEAPAPASAELARG